MSIQRIKKFGVSLATIMFAMTSPAIADEQEDIAEFNTAYAEYAELVQNGDDLDAAITAAEKVYKLAPRIYGKKSEEYAVVTYNLAELYDAKGGASSDEDERKALSLYTDYFNLIDEFKKPKDKSYLIQFQDYMQSYYNVNKTDSDDLLSEELLESARTFELTSIELAVIEHSVALNRFLYTQSDSAASLFMSVYNRYKSEYGEAHKKTGEILYWLAQIDIKNYDYKQAITKLDEFTEIYNSIENNDEKALIKSARLRLYELHFLLENDDKVNEHFLEFSKLNKKKAQDNYNKDDPNEYVPVKRTAPRYPRRAMDNMIEGFVILSLTVAADGTTKDIKSIIYNHEMFEKEAIKAAKKYKYRPRNVNGVPVDVENVLVNLVFRIQE